MLQNQEHLSNSAKLSILPVRNSFPRTYNGFTLPSARGENMKLKKRSL